MAVMRVKENCLKMMPVDPPKKAMGPNTADSTRPMPTRALVIWPMDFRVAARGGRPSSCMMRSTFSTTTMASSTRRPMASTMANMVSMLMDMPTYWRIAKVPRSTTGTAMVGIRVARKFPRKSSMTRKTRITASMRVFTTSLMATDTKGVVS